MDNNTEKITFVLLAAATAAAVMAGMHSPDPKPFPRCVIAPIPEWKAPRSIAATFTYGVPSVLNEHYQTGGGPKYFTDFDPSVLYHFNSTVMLFDKGVQRNLPLLVRATVDQSELPWCGKLFANAEHKDVRARYGDDRTGKHYISVVAYAEGAVRVIDIAPSFIASTEEFAHAIGLCTFKLRRVELRVNDRDPLVQCPVDNSL